MRTTLAILLGKLISFLSQRFKLGGGSAAPGLYALKIDPNLVEKLSKKIPGNVVITGTNGKTTTSGMLAHFAKSSGLKVIRNHTGSNLERGIASTLISSISWGSSLLNPRGWLRSNLGIWELDEAAFNTVAPKINPDVVVFLNVFRDQLDRYGEVDTVVKGWVETLKNLDKKTVVLVNGDDVNTKKLKGFFKGEVLQFGVKDYKIIGESIAYKKEKENLNCEVRDIELKGLSGSSFSVVMHDQPYPVILPLPGLYHIYDFLAAFYAGHELGFSTKNMISSVKNFLPAFGRVETFTFEPQGLTRQEPRDLRLKKGYIFLIKNPAGATQVFQTIAPQLKSPDRLLLALNDNLADGTDVSWIWDGNFERLTMDIGQLTSKNKISNVKSQMSIVCSGTRAYDLAVRLKYAGFDPKQINVEPDLHNALKQAGKGLKGRLFILPTYTAMLELQAILTKAGIKKHYWEGS